MAFKEVVNIEIAWFDDTENSSGAIRSKLSSDAATLKSIVGDSLALIVQNTTTLIGGLTLALLASWLLPLIVLALLPFISLKGCIRMNSRKGFIADAKVCNCHWVDSLPHIARCRLLQISPPEEIKERIQSQYRFLRPSLLTVMEKLMVKMKSKIGDSPAEEDAISHDLQNLIAPTPRNSTSTNAEGNGSKIKQDARDGNKVDQETQVVPIYKLFSFVDSTDIILMTLGTAGALANGATMPLLTVLVGSLINTFGEDPDIDQVVHRVSKVGKFIGQISTFFSAFVIAFAQGWLLTLVMVSVIPIIGLCSVIISKVTIKTASIGQKANAETSITGFELASN